MAFESDLVAVLAPLGGSVYPAGAVPAPLPTTKYTVYAQIGGPAINYADDLQPNLIQAHMQITVWSKQRAEAFAAMRAIEPAMRAAQAFTSRPLGAPESDYDADTKLHGARQDYLCTHAR